MTYSMIVGKYKLIFSDTHFKDLRKKPTISVYDADTNSETKIASFNSQEAFEWFIELITNADRKTEPTISILEQVEDEPQTENLFTDKYGDVWEWRGDAWYCISGDEPQTERSE